MEDRIIHFLDWTLDAHEEARNDQDRNRSFYDRAVFVMNNFGRYSNPTMCNILLDTKATLPQYDRLNSVVQQANGTFMLSATCFHVLSFMSMSYFFRLRRVGALPVLLTASAYFYVFETVNNILYKTVIDRRVLAEATRLGLQAHAQPAGTRKARGLNYL